MRIRVVADDATLRLGVTRTLRAQGCVVDEASSGESAMQAQARLLDETTDLGGWLAFGSPAPQAKDSPGRASAPPRAAGR